MPTYDYECDACDHKFELFQSIMAPVEKTCPKCKKKKLRRLIGTGAAIVFKGSGFYQTDYRSESYKKSASADSKPSEGSSSEAKESSSKNNDAKSASNASESKSANESSSGKSSGDSKNSSSSDSKPITKPSKPKGKKGE
ncbi:MAG: FmdB family zinc ribbon protein [Pirellulaceae bacterium]|nr:FmdB family zinc ribbon protein [Pirellulaceae bacterium]